MFHKQRMDDEPKLSINIHLTLCAILWNEADNVQDMLFTCVDYIDSAVLLLDDRTDDGTDAMIIDVLHQHEIPFQICKERWSDFATARNKCLAKVSCETTHVLFLDGDERLYVHSPDFRADLEVYDVCMMQVITKNKTGETMIRYPNLFRWHKSIKFVGKIHEQPMFPVDYTVQDDYLDAVIVHRRDHTDRVKKFKRDLEICLNDEDVFPDSYGRREYYIAQCYLNLQQPNSAMVWFKKRMWMQTKDLGKDDEEKWHAGFMFAICLVQVGRLVEAIDQFTMVYTERPTRAEPLDMMAKLYAELGYEDKAQSLRNKMTKMVMPQNDRVGLNPSLYGNKSGSDETSQQNN